MDGTDDEDVRRLQRIAFGAHASAEERRVALAALDRRGQGAAASQGEARAVATGDAGEGAESDAGVDDPVTSARFRSRGSALRVAILTGAVALVVGAAAGFVVGWQLPTMAPVGPTASTGSPATVGPGSRLHSDVFAAMPLALETEAARVFDREQTPADVPDLAVPLAVVSSLPDVVETRLLATRPDGVGVYAARDDTDLCLFATFPEGGAASVCTERGRFPTEGLRLAVAMDGPDVDIDVAWSPDGVLRFATPH